MTIEEFTKNYGIKNKETVKNGFPNNLSPAEIFPRILSLTRQDRHTLMHVRKQLIQFIAAL